MSRIDEEPAADSPNIILIIFRKPTGNERI